MATAMEGILPATRELLQVEHMYVRLPTDGILNFSHDLNEFSSGGFEENTDVFVIVVNPFTATHDYS